MGDANETGLRNRRQQRQPHCILYNSSCLRLLKVGVAIGFQDQTRRVLLAGPYCAEYDGEYHTPLGRLFKLDCSTTKRVPISSDTPSESSRRDLSNADLVGTDTMIPRVEISSMENRPTVVYCKRHHLWFAYFRTAAVFFFKNYPNYQC